MQQLTGRGACVQRLLRRLPMALPCPPSTLFDAIDVRHDAQRPAAPDVFSISKFPPGSCFWLNPPHFYIHEGCHIRCDFLGQAFAMIYKPPGKKSLSGSRVRGRGAVI